MPFLASLLALAACDGSYKSSTKTYAADGSETSSSSFSIGTGPSETHEPPPMFEGTYAPLSKTAQSITDEIEFDGDRLLFGFGHVYGTEPAGPAGDADAAAFAEAASAPAATRFEVRRVTEELVNARADNGGLCSPDAATFLVVGAVPDPGGSTRDVVMLAYKGAQAPAAASAEQDLCGTFLYGRPAG